MTHRVTSMPRASVAEDGSIVELEFETEGGMNQTLQFDADAFGSFVSRAQQLFNHVQTQRLTIGDPFAIHTLAVVEAMADAPVGGGKVILALRGDTGQVFHFALPPGKAEQLRKSLFGATRSARKQSSQPRH